MIAFVHAKRKHLKFSSNTRYRLLHRQYDWQKTKDIHEWMISIKIIYITIFLCFTIFICLNQSINNHIQCLTTYNLRIWDMWYSFVCLILVLSLFIDRLKKQKRVPLKIIYSVEVLLVVALISIVIIGHIQAYKYLWWSAPSIRVTRITLYSIVCVDLCPLSVAVMMIIHSLKKARAWYRIHASNIISDV